MKKIDFKSCLKIGITVFVLYLCIHYWSVAAGLIKTLIGAVMPLIIGAVLAYPLNIITSFYERHCFPNSHKAIIVKSRRGMSITLALLTLIAILALVVALVVPQLVSCIKLLVAEVPTFINAIVEKLGEYDFVPEDIIASLSEIDWKTKITENIKAITSGVGSVMGVVVGAVSSVVSGVATAVIALIVALSILSGKEKLGSQLKRALTHYIPARYMKKLTYIASVADDSFHKFIVAQCTEAVILGGLCTVGMLILRLPYAAMIGAVTAVSAFIPVVGAFIGGGIGAFLILMESPSKALVFLVFIILLQQIEGDLIYPKVVGSSMGLPSLWVLAAVTVGGGVFGIMGMLLGVPLASTVYKIIRDDINETGSVDLIPNIRQEDEAKSEEPITEPEA